MKNIRRILLSGLFILWSFGFSLSTFAGERATKEEAVAMVKKAVAFYKANGREKSLVAFSDQTGQFRDRELFLIVLDPKGVAVAHTALKKMIGANIMELKDVNGVMIIKSFFKAAEKNGSGWSDEYVFINPATQQMEPKRTYVEKVDDLLIACGYHFVK
ncbi:MAG: cache domain-containing protein [Undibacterium sp.]|nr:cache domain-containing protein [Undibacterium sp.]